ncbi:MAG: 4-hydroxy-tetrahydrodipicolinate synthase [Pseudomonadota bacterium]|jgi:4-hydroxy-tetrahydrodipicolinate synthase|uniref:4-hydroxy-tetrahydrodipicolinate synthase n=2 Tax=Methylophaga TaxID=40222 RepID=F5SXR2_9GAMM|nr:MULTISPECIES: 4-hydroxy-tetrahydrodipicolinate synthase [Methylophaga]MEC9413700.1 4-hydroxy-tetrahydrodipicolinate synthase [Pseudomonadota bacterium]EGL55292.1 dihydrodipicolinate synthase/N-acetylneuraminate lyase [Methylophaga aminisulfidivorans MP]WVI84030.1 4-hydroxy-tetrahydrodipicolinate synthase [Methylophaga thalassica]GLP99132.1 4-hydroxy-tetrahydrodipicolinate synthase [Methylophaga thalassica]HIC46195.1 4-hydroxy-tetrahydrodipicolinate synthase [Methylophaga sp.]
MFSGSMVALVTPMQADGALDVDSLRKLVEFHISQGTDAIVAVGTTGESATLSVEEHCDVIRLVVEQVNGRIPVIAGTGANSTSEAIELTQSAKDLGVDAVLLVAPYYNKPTQQGMYLHFKAIAEAVNIPQILYNVPGRTASDLLPETVGRLSELSNIIGIKEATGDVSRVQQIKQLSREGFELYTGEDANTVDFILAGGQGVISVTANVAPKLMHEMCQAALAGDETLAREINLKLVALHQFLFVESNPIPVKWALNEMRLISSGIRLPMTVLSENYHQSVRDALNTAGVLN